MYLIEDIMEYVNQGQVCMGHYSAPSSLDIS